MRSDLAVLLITGDPNIDVGRDRRPARRPVAPQALHPCGASRHGGKPHHVSAVAVPLDPARGRAGAVPEPAGGARVGLRVRPTRGTQSCARSCTGSTTRLAAALGRVEICEDALDEADPLDCDLLRECRHEAQRGILRARITAPGSPRRARRVRAADHRAHRTRASEQRKSRGLRRGSSPRVARAPEFRADRSWARRTSPPCGTPTCRRPREPARAAR